MAGMKASLSRGTQAHDNEVRGTKEGNKAGWERQTHDPQTEDPQTEDRRSSSVVVEE